MGLQLLSDGGVLVTVLTTPDKNDKKSYFEFKKTHERFEHYRAKVNFILKIANLVESCINNTGCTFG